MSVRTITIGERIDGLLEDYIPDEDTRASLVRKILDIIVTFRG